jgi:hypothetical protein
MSQQTDNQDPNNPTDKISGDKSVIIENKIDFLINLNLMLLNLLIKQSSKDHLQTPLSDHVLEELIAIHKTLPKILTSGESKVVFIKQIEKIDEYLTEIIGATETGESVETEPSISPTHITPKIIEGDYQRLVNPIDKWGIIESLVAFLNSYKALSHLAFPDYFLEACMEIQRYRLHKKVSEPNPHEIIQIPALKLKDLVQKLLREAPAARLLQNLKKLFPLESSRELDENEKEVIQEIVEKYYSHIYEYIDGNRSLEDTVRVSTTILQQYNLGSGDLESRIPNVSFSVVKDIYQEFQQNKGNSFRQYIYSETIVLIHRLNDAILQNERYLVFLRRLK